MFGLSEKTRWALILLGTVLITLGVLDHKAMLSNYPTLEYVVFPYIWVIGIILAYIGYGFSKEGSKPSGSGGVDGAPYETKKGPMGDGSFWGDGGGSGGGD